MKIKKIGISLLLSIILIVVNSGCSFVLNQDENIIKNAVQKKYNKHFSQISSQLDLKNNITTMVFKDKNNVKFEATKEKNSKIVDDNYIYRVISNKINNKIKKCLSVENCLNSVIICDDCSNETNSDIKLSDFKKKYNLKGLQIYIALNYDNINSEKLYNNLEKLIKLNVLDDYSLYFSTFSYKKDTFLEIKDKISEIQEINNTLFDEFNPVKKFSFNIERGIITPEINIIINNLSKYNFGLSI